MTLSIYVRVPKEKPLLEDIVGSPKNFVEDFVSNVNLELMHGRMGVAPEKSFLLYGPPGTGKTLSTEVINNELNKGIIGKEKLKPDNLKLLTFEYTVGNYGTAYINQGSKIIQKFFDTAYAYASIGKKTFLIFDEADGLFESRSSGSHGSREDKKIIETLMLNLQTAHDTPGVYLTLITNFEKSLDDAAIRSGRIDKKIKFALPNEEERFACFEYEIDKINEKADYKVIRKYNSEQLANLSSGMNYGDIGNIAQGAVRIRIKEMMKSSKGIASPYLTQKYLLKSLEGIEASKENKTPGFKNNF